MRRAVLTVAIVLAAVAGARIPLPGVDAGLLLQAGAPPMGILDLGLAPFLSAFVLVELIAIAIPPLRALRTNGAPGRQRLTVVSAALGLLLAAVQGFSIVSYLGAIGVAPSGGPAIPILSLVAGSGLLLLAAGFVSARGIGNGVAVLLAAQTLTATAASFRRTLSSMEQVGALGAGLWLLLVAFLLAVILRALHANELTTAGGTGRRVRHPACGLVPVGIVSAALLMPATLSGWLPGLKPLADALRPGTSLYLGASLLGVALLATRLARLFNPPGAVAAAWRGVPAEAGGGVDAPSVRAEIGRSGLRAATLLVAWLGVPIFLLQELGFSRPAPTALVMLTLAVAVLADVRGEWRARRKADLVELWPESRLYAADALAAALRAEGIEPFLRAVHYRTLTPFFASWAPIVVCVPRERMAEATAIAERLLGGAGRGLGSAPGRQGRR